MAALATPLTRRLGIEHPIFGFADDISTVAAITNAGGLGVYGATRRFPDEIRDELAEIRSLVGDRPFGVDLVLPDGMPEHNSRAEIERHIPDGHRAFVEAIIEKYQVPEPSGPGMRTRFIRSSEIEVEQLEAVMASDVDLFACGIGAPRPAVDRARELGKTTAALIGSPRHVRRAIDSGVDIIVAQGHDAGAHTGPRPRPPSTGSLTDLGDIHRPGGPEDPRPGLRARLLSSCHEAVTRASRRPMEAE